MTDKTHSWQDNEALQRFNMIAPLLDDSLDPASRIRLRESIAEQTGRSVRTLYRYEEAFRNGGFAGLKPEDRTRKLSAALPENFQAVLEQAKQLKRENPKRSISQIIVILELEGWAEPGVLKRSTLQRYLYEAGLGKKQLKVYNESLKSSNRRFCKPHRMMLVQGDLKYGPKLPIGKNGTKVQTYLSALIDDHSRMILSSAFYATGDASIVEDTLRKAILQYGVPDALYFDNGVQFKTREMKMIAAQLGIRLMYCKPYSPSSKGKIERYNHCVSYFLEEARLKKCRTLEELNRHWVNWLEEYYHSRPHDGIREYYESRGVKIPEAGITPVQEFNRDARPLKFMDAEVVGRAFMHHAKREVDKAGCISLAGKTYETKVSLAGMKVDVDYDPMDLSVLTVSCSGVEPFQVHPLVIGEFCAKKPELPKSVAETPDTSRFLDALEKKHADSRTLQANAISFGAFRKEGGGHV